MIYEDNSKVTGGVDSLKRGTIYTNYMKKQLVAIVSLLIVALALVGARGVRAQEATSTPPINEEPLAAATTTTPISEPPSTGDQTATTTPPAAEPTPPSEQPPSSTEPPLVAPTPDPVPAPTAPATESAPLPEPSPSAQPSAPAIVPVVPFQPNGDRAFDAATAPSKAKLKILTSSGSAPTIPVFVTFVGVGGKTYGGPVDKEGSLETIMPTGRYYTDILVIDTKLGPPTNPPSFFLEANEERDFGILTLTETSSFTDTALEQEVATALDGERGFAKVFSLIIKLLLALLKELRGLRSDLLLN